MAGFQSFRTLKKSPRPQLDSPDEVSLEPGQLVEFFVEEEAKYTETISDLHSIRGFLIERCQVLLTSGAMSKPVHEAVVDYEKNELHRAMLNTLNLRSKRGAVNGSLEPLATKQEMVTWSNYRNLNDLIPVFEKIENDLSLVEVKQEKTRAIDVLKDIIKTTFENQKRIRENIKSMESVSSEKSEKLVARYLNDLNREEDALIQARSDILILEKALLSIEAQRGTLRFELASRIDELGAAFLEKARKIGQSLPTSECSED